MNTPLPVTLTGRSVRLEPLLIEHAPGLLEIGREESIWTWLPRGPLTDLDDAKQWIEGTHEGLRNGARLPFAIISLTDGAVAGSTSYLNISVRDQGIEIGWTWLGLKYQRTAVNTEAKLLLMTHAFETLGAQRLQLKTDELNERSRRAIERIGAKFEGILRRSQITRGGRIRNTAMYSVLVDEWPGVKAKLEERVGIANG